MPSYQHEALLVLLQDSSKLPPGLLRYMKVEVPQYTEARPESTNLTDLQPAEYRADLVWLLLREQKPVLGIIIEVQLSIDEDKKYAWPAYIANLRSRLRCPVCLLVVTMDESVARWAGKPIDLGVGNFITPLVLRPSNMPEITDLAQAEADVALAVLSAVAHANDRDVQQVARIASAAITATATLGSNRGDLYWDLIFDSLPEDAKRALVEMNPAMHEYMSDFARRYVAEGRDKGKEEGRLEGRVEGRVEVLLRLLTLQFGPLPDVVRARVQRACSAEGELLIDAVLTAKTLEEVLAAM